MEKLDNIKAGQLLDNALTAISIWNRDGDCIYQNAEFLKLSGLTRQYMETANVFNLEKKATYWKMYCSGLIKKSVG